MAEATVRAKAPGSHLRVMSRHVHWALASPSSLASLLLSLKANAHAVLDEASASRVIGLGLFPAACLLNHSCLPSALLVFRHGGRELQLRSLTDLPAGAEVCYSYLDEAQLCSPWCERRALLRATHFFEPTEPEQRAATEAAARCAHAEFAPLLAQSRQAMERVQHAIGGMEAGDARARRAGEEAVGALRDLLTRKLRPLLHPAHDLLHDCLVTLLAAARTLDDPPLIASISLQLLEARECVLPVGTPYLANLYMAHAAALCRILRAGQIADERKAGAEEQADAALAAAGKIRATCLGADHPSFVATVAAHQAFRKERARRKQKAGQ